MNGLDDAIRVLHFRASRSQHNDDERLAECVGRVEYEVRMVELDRDTALEREAALVARVQAQEAAFKEANVAFEDLLTIEGYANEFNKTSLVDLIEPLAYVGRKSMERILDTARKLTTADNVQAQS